MSIITKTRCSDSPFVESITRGQTIGDGTTIRPAESHWHMVFVQMNGTSHALVVGALPGAGTVSWGAGAEILWVKFKLGAFMPHLPARNFLNTEKVLPQAARQSFWLRGAAFEFPDFENADTFVQRLARDQTLVYDASILAALKAPPAEIPARTLRHRFLRATGLTQTHIHQIQRAQHAEQLLKQGTLILDTVEAAGYFDQPHLTRALKRWIGFTPAEIARQSLGASNSISV